MKKTYEIDHPKGYGPDDIKYALKGFWTEGTEPKVTFREVPDREEQGKLLEEAINYIQWQITLKKAVGTECPKAEALVARYEAAKKERA